MNSGKSIFAQLMDFLPSKAFRRCVKRYQGDYKLKTFSCWDQFLCMAFAQLTYRESLRDKLACARNTPSFTISAFAAKSRAIPWPMQTRCAIGASTPTSRKC